MCAMWVKWLPSWVLYRLPTGNHTPRAHALALLDLPAFQPGPRACTFYFLQIVIAFARKLQTFRVYLGITYLVTWSSTIKMHVTIILSILYTFIFVYLIFSPAHVRLRVCVLISVCVTVPWNLYMNNYLNTETTRRLYEGEAALHVVVSIRKSVLIQTWSARISCTARGDET